MSTTSNKKSQKARLSSTQKKARDAVSRLPRVQTRRLPKPRVGFETLVEPLAEIVEQFGDLLGAGLDVEGMRASLKAYQDLDADYRAAVNHLAGIESARLVDSSNVWMQILDIYARCRAVGRTNSTLLGAIQPIGDFMRTGPRKANKATTPTAPVTTAATTPTP